MPPEAWLPGASFVGSGIITVFLDKGELLAAGQALDLRNETGVQVFAHPRIGFAARPAAQGSKILPHTAFDLAAIPYTEIIEGKSP